MEKGFILSLIFAAIVALFALNNSAKVLIDLFFIELEISQAIIILISTLFGALIVAIFTGVRSLKLKKEIRDLKRNLDEEKAKIVEKKASFEKLEEEKNKLELLVDSLEEDKENLQMRLNNPSQKLDTYD